MKNNSTFLSLAGLLLLFCFAFAIGGCGGIGQSSGFPYIPDWSAQTPQTTGSVTGIVTNYITLAPVAGAQVSVGGINATTAADGSYTLQGVAAGTFPVSAAMTGFSAFSGTVTIVAGETATVNIEMHPFDVVAATVPVDGAIDVPHNQVITVTFGNNIITGAGFAGITLSHGATIDPVTASVAGNTLTIDPVSNLVNDMLYTVTIPYNAIDGTRVMASDFSFSFTTGPSYIYVTDFSNRVSVINSATNAVTNIPLSGATPTGIDFLPDGSRAYVACVNGDVISIIDTSTNVETGTIDVTGTGPMDIAVSPGGAFAYITNYALHSVSILNTATNTISPDTITLGVDTGPTRVVFSPDGKRAYVSNTTSNSVSVIDTATHTVAGAITDFNGPAEIKPTRDGAFAYVANNTGNNVIVIDTSTNTKSATIDLVPNPWGIDFTPDGSLAYVSNTGGTNLSIINTSTNTVAGAVSTTSITYGVAIVPSGSFAYVASVGIPNNVNVINMLTNTVITTIPTGLAPYDAVIRP